jgi:GAF domain-containing protein
MTLVTQKMMGDEKALEETNKSLQESRSTLQNCTHLLEQRNAALGTIAEIAPMAAKNLDKKTLLDQIANLVANRLNISHISIFLLDIPGENMVQAASNSETRQVLPDEQHELRVSRQTVYTARTPDTNELQYKLGDDIYRVDKPATISGLSTNLSFPLVAGTRLLGLINVQQSEEIRAEEEEFLQTIANQIILSLENTRLMTELQIRLQEISRMAGERVQQSWRAVSPGKPFGYAYDRLQVLPSEETYPPEVTKQLLARKVVSYATRGGKNISRLVAPIVIREEIIGTIGYENIDPKHQWSTDEIAMLETIAAQIGLALENNRLVAEAQQRVERELILGHVAARMRETLDIDLVLQTAVREMKQSLNLEQAEVRLQLTDQQEEQTGRGE